jgi:hypothetical protein
MRVRVSPSALTYAISALVMTFSLDDRVRIAERYHWAQGAIGTICLPPYAVTELQGAARWTGAMQMVDTLRGQSLSGGSNSMNRRSMQMATAPIMPPRFQ